MGEEVKNGKSRIGSFLGGALFGALVGSVAALIFAPKSGRELRGDIQEQFTAAKEKTSQVKDTVVQKGNEWKSIALDATSKVTRSLKKQSNELLDKVQSLTKKSGESIEETLEDAKETIEKIGEEIDRKLEALKEGKREEPQEEAREESR